MLFRSDKALKALESEHSLLTKSHDQLQTQLSKNDVPSSSSRSCDHANIIEENARLNDELIPPVEVANPALGFAAAPASEGSRR